MQRVAKSSWFDLVIQASRPAVIIRASGLSSNTKPGGPETIAQQRVLGA
jgi:hypothetical protein